MIKKLQKQYCIDIARVLTVTYSMIPRKTTGHISVKNPNYLCWGKQLQKKESSHKKNNMNNVYWQLSTFKLMKKLSNRIRLFQVTNERSIMKESRKQKSWILISYLVVTNRDFVTIICRNDIFSPMLKFMIWL